MSSNISRLMMVNLMEALCANRLRCTSSRCVFKPPRSAAGFAGTASFINHTTLQLTAADGSFVCSLSPSTVVLVLDGKPAAAVVTANSFGDNGVWIQVSCRCQKNESFWLEAYVPTSSLPASNSSSVNSCSMLPRA